MVVCTLCPTVSGWRSQRQPTPPPPLPSFFPPTTGRTTNTNYLIAICVTGNTSHKQVKTQNREIQRLLVAVLDGCAGSAQGRWTQGGLGDAQPTGRPQPDHVGSFILDCSVDYSANAVKIGNYVCTCTYMYMHIYLYIYKQTINNGHQVIKYRLHNARDQRHFILYTLALFQRFIRFGIFTLP